MDSESRSPSLCSENLRAEPTLTCTEPSEADCDGIFDTYVLETFRWHKGFPKDEEARKRYEQYVYPNIREYNITHAAFRESHYQTYRSNVLGWFLVGDWMRFPDVLTEDEYKDLTRRQKKKYDELSRAFPIDAGNSELNSASIYLQKARLWDGIRRGTIATIFPTPPTYENIFSKKELKKYANHPGFPRDPERLATYERFVFPPLEEGEDGEELTFKTNDEFRNDHGKAHNFYVREWFGNGAWNRYPNIASAEEIESFCSEDKECLKSYLQEDLYDMEDPDLASQYRAIRCHWYARYRPMWYKERNLPLPDLDFRLF